MFHWHIGCTNKNSPVFSWSSFACFCNTISIPASLSIHWNAYFAFVVTYHRKKNHLLLASYSNYWLQRIHSKTDNIELFLRDCFYWCTLYLCDILWRDAHQKASPHMACMCVERQHVDLIIHFLMFSMLLFITSTFLHNLLYQDHTGSLTLRYTLRPGLLIL